MRQNGRAPFEEENEGDDAEDGDDAAVAFEDEGVPRFPVARVKRALEEGCGKSSSQPDD